MRFEPSSNSSRLLFDTWKKSSRGSAALFLVGVIFFGATLAEAHVRVTPQGRMGASDSAKFVQNNKNNPSLVPDSPGPCQNFNTRMATPLQLTPGQQLTFQVQETINHPGRFYVQISRANDSGFWDPANQLALVEDPNNRATTPVTITVPNINCNTCTFRVLQEMDEQPGEFYVHCIDANIGTVQSTPSPPPVVPPGGGGTQSASSVTKVAEKPGFGGCGLVRSNDRGDSGDSSGGFGSSLYSSGPSPLSKTLWYLVLFAPLLLALRLRALENRFATRRIITAKPNFAAVQKKS